MNSVTTRARRKRWWMAPTTMLVLGSGLIVASALGGSDAGVPGEVVIVVVATALFAGLGRFSRSDIGAIMGGGPDERQVGIEVRATAAAGVGLAIILVVGAMVELAMGGNGQPWVSLGAAFGVLYVVSLFVLRRR
jgi:hypothetical protein